MPEFTAKGLRNITKISMIFYLLQNQSRICFDRNYYTQTDSIYSRLPEELLAHLLTTTMKHSISKKKCQQEVVLLQP